MSYLSRKEMDELRPQIEKAVSRCLGFTESAIVTTAVNCLASGYDRRKTTDKLSALLDDRKATKVAEKIYAVYDDMKAAQKAKKRSYDDRSKDRDKDRDSKKLKLKEDDSKGKAVNNSSKEKGGFNIGNVMANAQKQIEERKKALKVVKPDLDSVRPLIRNSESLVSSIGTVYNQGFLKKTDSERARKIAALQMQIQSKLKSGLLGNAQSADKPKPLILDESGRIVDITGKEVHLTHVVPTLKANIRAKKREEFKAQMQDSKGTEEFQETHFFDNRIGVKSSVRNKRALKFHEPGKFVQLAERIRMKAQLEKLQNEISQIARKTGISASTKLALIAPKTEALSEDVPNIEWWDSVILNKEYNNDSNDIMSCINISTITNLVEHPAQMRPPTEPTKPIEIPVFLTKKERKKLRRQNRREAWKEEQEKIRLGLEPPPEPKLRISNLMRVLGTEAVQDPTKIEAHVRQQMAKRLKAHEDANAARRLTADQRREKKARKLKEDTSLGVHVAVFRIRDLINNASKKFKVDANAKQLYLTGCVMLFRDCNVVVVEGGIKQIAKYKRLMLRRIKWEEDTVKDMDGKDVPNKCVLVWEGMSKQRHFGEIKFKTIPIEREAREHFKKHHVEHYWDLAYSGAVLDNTDEVAI
ncbi:U4/U6 small nuclear ribonucleoprotein Prp3 [Copidosoma floridanum]|uniref:U4/U6 small nuclear ribonucleoprotein Prp3 n=1 Tax=Copidosoma floridanum TaxID=29053 RepID=UPI0006C9708E|nr:U4/U6 small nuclear ribonucleoprotein Prp3 [Copidosoma floridanum]XP_014219798.1 U4/U6 small nuclear ribonucleoprotein Prp3 [Copidosoma floridanum]